SSATSARVLSVDYRLAPEHPFPAAIDDVLACYHWLLEQGTDPAKVMVGGLSAGGGLTLALLLALKDASAPFPAGAVALSAWADLAQTGETFVTKADADPTISKAYLDRMAGYYLGAQDPTTPLASPLYGDLAGLPPVLLQVGTAETLLSDSIAFAKRAEDAGVDVVLEQWPDMFHGWHGSAHVLAQAREAIDAIGKFFRAHT
ncbi:MAG: alpha/beta hydrolase, partial [Gammaproteobacteria bacterium]|nr:alpha/beta hydrolase [Gammaproteobacteria bacterium]